MKERQVVLRAVSVQGATRDVFRPQAFPERAFPQGLEASAIPLALRVEVEELEARHIPALASSADVLAVAPAMPMRLIAPVEVQDAQVAASGTAWGISAVGADTSSLTGSGITVAVLDTGIDASHPAFAGVTLTQRDFTGEGEGDGHGHGTHCAGTIFGRDVGGLRIGVAPGVTRAVIGKVLGNEGGSSEQIVSAIQWALEEGAQVISMSLGMDFPGFVKLLQDRGMKPEPATSLALEGYRANVLLFERLASFIRARGAFLQSTLIVAAAGNESERPEYEIAVSPPAVAEGILSVAALKQDGAAFAVAPFSNTGANVAAPGVGIVSARKGGGLASMSGTSMATPHVAGVAALWAERIKDGGGVLNPLNLTAQLIASATTSTLKPGFDPVSVGTGLVRAPQ